MLSRRSYTTDLYVMGRFLNGLEDKIMEEDEIRKNGMIACLILSNYDFTNIFARMNRI